MKRLVDGEAADPGVGPTQRVNLPSRRVARGSTGQVRYFHHFQDYGEGALVQISMGSDLHWITW